MQYVLNNVRVGRRLQFDHRVAFKDLVRRDSKDFGRLHRNHCVVGGSRTKPRDGHFSSQLNHVVFGANVIDTKLVELKSVFSVFLRDADPNHLLDDGADLPSLI